eukprot:GGOE01003829.1.p1 GENE.GGOE01003829.1~~GGOE01003829.1.p1  ORF type:complete len:233 (-),score=37.77 GGOE01003829.1:184-882(-)
MQAQGQRVITLLMQPDQLRHKHVSHLLYMRVPSPSSSDGTASAATAPQHDRDALEFLLHDIKHMENFGGDSVTYVEQVGFCRALLQLGEVVGRGPTPRPFFTAARGADAELWGELEYVISDMNCISNHLLAYLKAKWLLAHQRLSLSVAVSKPFDECWLEFLAGIGMEEGTGAHAAAVRLCNPTFDGDRDIRPIRDFFAAIGAHPPPPEGGAAPAAHPLPGEIGRCTPRRCL